MTNKLQPFHLAMPVSDLATTRQFYGEFLGFEEGRSNDHWIDWNFLVTNLSRIYIQKKANKLLMRLMVTACPCRTLAWFLNGSNGTNLLKN